MDQINPPVALPSREDTPSTVTRRLLLSLLGAGGFASLLVLESAAKKHKKRNGKRRKGGSGSGNTGTSNPGSGNTGGFNYSPSATT